MKKIILFLMAFTLILALSVPCYANSYHAWVRSTYESGSLTYEYDNTDDDEYLTYDEHYISDYVKAEAYMNHVELYVQTGGKRDLFSEIVDTYTIDGKGLSGDIDDLYLNIYYSGAINLLESNGSGWFNINAAGTGHRIYPGDFTTGVFSVPLNNVEYDAPFEIMIEYWAKAQYKIEIDYFNTAYWTFSTSNRGNLFDVSSLGEYTPYIDQTEPIPEPTTMLLLGAGLIGLAGLGRKRVLRKG